jgi:putative FmdB family regulatory protein
MPIYEYKCKQCGALFEAIVLSGEVSALCRTCGSDQVERQLSTFAVSAGGSPSHPQPGSDACLNCPSAQQGTCQMRH